MYRKMPLATSVLVCAILIGLIGHGTELFYNVEGGESADLSAQVYAFVKAFGFPFAIESGNAIALFVGFNPNTRGGLTRFVAFLIGTGCFITSCLIQYHYFRFRIDADWWYAGVLPGLVALLSALAGLLDRDLAGDEIKGEELPHYQQSQVVDPMPMLHEALAAMQRQVNMALGEVADLVEREVEKRVQIHRPAEPVTQPVRVQDFISLAELEEPVEIETATGRAARIRQMREARKTWKEIATLYQVSEKTVQNWAKELNKERDYIGAFVMLYVRFAS
ncbi:MAG TPA: helix-turn-helix domain-containing protein [Chloroflexia bacterium]|nr:helix-turn-helix domain-containing protein [Chloroflexia bacterium]